MIKRDSISIQKEVTIKIRKIGQYLDEHAEDITREMATMAILDNGFKISISIEHDKIPTVTIEKEYAVI